MLFISHDLGVIAEMADRVVVMYAGQVVEQATVEEVFVQPRHPYTAGLLGCDPGDRAGRRLVDIPGNVPPPGYAPPGCRFHPRCRMSQRGRCDQIRPALERLGDVACDACAPTELQLPGIVVPDVKA